MSVVSTVLEAVASPGTAALSMLGGGLFRSVWGEVSSYINKKQDHDQEMARMAFQSGEDEKTRAHQIAVAKLEHEQGLEVIHVKGDIDYKQLELDTWGKGAIEGMKPSGVKIVDGWNASIRPAAATLALWLWGHSVYVAHWAMTDQDWNMACAIIGFFFADRTLAKRGK